MTCCADCFAWLCGNTVDPRHKLIVDTGGHLIDLSGVRNITILQEPLPNKSFNYKIEFLYANGIHTTHSHGPNKKRAYKEYRILKKALLPSQQIRPFPGDVDFFSERDAYKEEVNRLIAKHDQLNANDESLTPLSNSDLCAEICTTYNVWSSLKIPHYYAIKHKEFLLTIDGKFKRLKEKAEQIAKSTNEEEKALNES